MQNEERVFYSFRCSAHQLVGKVGFTNVRCVDVATTTLEEQRKTDWLENESLIDFLDPNDHSKTIEGYQAPTRAVILANK